MMNLFVDVLLPIPLARNFTYSCPSELEEELKPGIRVVVPFGKSKLYTGLVLRIHNQPPEIYEAKDIHSILDETPLLGQEQVRFWNWIAEYYMCTVGEVFRTAVPGALLLSSETQVSLNPDFEDLEEHFDTQEQEVITALRYQKVLPIQDIGDILERKHVMPLLNRMMARNIIRLKEEIQQIYKPKMVRYIRLSPRYARDEDLEALMTELSRAPKQSQVILYLFQLGEGKSTAVPSKTLEMASGVSRTILKGLIDKSILEEFEQQEYRVQYVGDSETRAFTLNTDQKLAVSDILDGFKKEQVTLLFGVTSSGKTEVYLKLIESQLEAGKQVLFLVPEIALTTQLIQRLQDYFGDQVGVFHSKYSQHERVELWQQVLDNDSRARIILGARSALFLPFQALGLIIVDEEHEMSYKQFDPAPRYHARDAAIVLASYYTANIVLGSATPSIESYQNVRTGKYALAQLKHRYGNILMPDMELVDLSVQYKRKKMKGHFSERLRDEIEQALEQNKQVILFQNRRGFAPIMECTSCGFSPQCPHCDVSLTYHQFRNQLRCHYCGFHREKETECQACGNPTLDTKGFGTEQVEEEVKTLFPEAKTARMDLDTTRGKYAYDKIIGAFENREIDILVGTQMLSKGLDFREVALVGIMNADNLLNFPHFRAHERCYQLLTQVAGRAGRTKERGKVIIQSYNPYHQILKQVTTGDYETMFQEQIYEREQFHYPPVNRIIKITFRHKEYQRLNEGADWFAKALRQFLHDGVLGPEFPPVARIRNQYHKQILIKINRKLPLAQTKNSIKRIEKSFNAISQFRSIRLIYNVDYI